MTASFRVAALAGAAAIFIAGAGAAPYSSAKLGFSAAFPCKAQKRTETVEAPFGRVPVTSLSCDKDRDIYNVSVSLYPRGFAAKHKNLYRNAVNGAATNAGGKVRTVSTYPLGNVTGRDALIDVPAQHAAAHLRVFFVGDKQYQVMFLGPKGHENGKAAGKFLNSFRLK